MRSSRPTGSPSDFLETKLKALSKLVREEAVVGMSNDAPVSRFGPQRFVLDDFPDRPDWIDKLV